MIYTVYSHSFADTGEVFYYGAGKKGRELDRVNRVSKYKAAVGKRSIIVRILCYCGTKGYAHEVENKLISRAFEDGEKIINCRKEEKTSIGKIAGASTYSRKTGIFSLASEETAKNCRKGGSIGGKEVGKQRWKCSQCGLVSTPGALGRHQKYLDHVGRERVQ